MEIGIPLLHEHVSRALGTDMFEPEGDRLVALALLDIYSHALIDARTADSRWSGGSTSRRANRAPPRSCGAEVAVAMVTRQAA